MAAARPDAAGVRAAGDSEDSADERVAEASKLYSIDPWLQPRSMVQVQLAKLKEETRCPMCFGKIRNARISMVCLHRYCAKCIEQYLRAKVPGRHGDEKECPVCRAHLHSRRATKPDPVFDKIIKALYGDVEQFDAEEEALIAADNKRHVAAWQAQLADLKARQAAAVAAARAAGPLPGAGSGHGLDSLGARGGRGGAGAFPGLGKRTQSWASVDDDDDDEDLDGPGYGASTHRSRGGGRGPKLPRGPSSRGGASSSRAAAYGSDDDNWTAPSRSGRHRGGRTATPFAAAATPGRQGMAGGGPSRGGGRSGGGGAGGRGAGSSRPLSPAGSLRRKKRRSTRELAVRLIGLAAHAAAAASPQPRCCLVHLVPALPPATPASAPGRPEARSRKQPKGGRMRGVTDEVLGQLGPPQQPQQQPTAPPQWQLVPRGEFFSPELDQPFLTCPWDLGVASLKRLLLQQLRQQGSSPPPLPGSECEVQLLWPPDAAAAGAGCSGDSGFDEGLTVGELHDTSPYLGPELRLTYRVRLQDVAGAE